MSKSYSTPIGEIYRKMLKERNPVTKSVYRDIYITRLNRLESK